MKITVVGIGYVGLANAILLAQNNKVNLMDIISDKVDLINQRKSPIQDPYISEYEYRPFFLLCLEKEIQ